MEIKTIHFFIRTSTCFFIPIFSCFHLPHLCLRCFSWPKLWGKLPVNLANQCQKWIFLYGTMRWGPSYQERTHLEGKKTKGGRTHRYVYGVSQPTWCRTQSHVAGAFKWAGTISLFAFFSPFEKKYTWRRPKNGSAKMSCDQPKNKERKEHSTKLS